MQRMPKWKIIVALFVVTLIILCCLFNIFFTGPSEAKRYEFQPKEHNLTSDYFTVEVVNAYQEKQRFWQIATDSLRLSTEEDVLVLEVNVINRQPASLDLICYLRDSTGDIYSPKFKGENILLPSFEPLETRNALMEFYSLPNDNQELWFHCGLCDNKFLCVAGKLNDVAARIK